LNHAREANAMHGQEQTPTEFYIARRKKQPTVTGPIPTSLDFMAG
jgi:hypothetical protein